MPASTAVDGFSFFGDEPLVAPALLWSEVPSVLHQRLWRGDLAADVARAALQRFQRSPLRMRRHPRLIAVAWALADQLGWMRTYDAEYVALAQLLGCRLVTADGRLKRGTTHLGFVIGPTEL